MKRKKTGKKTKTKKAAPNAAKKEAQKAASTKPQMRGEGIDIREHFLDCAIQQLAGVNILNYNELEGFPFKFGRVHVTEKLTAMLTPDALDLDRQRLLCIVIMLGRIARHVNSLTLPRIIKLRKDMDRLYSSAADAFTAANALRLAGELENCHDLLLSELEFMDADARKAALQAVWHSQTAAKGEEGKSVNEVTDGPADSIKALVDVVKTNNEILEVTKNTNAIAKNLEAVAVYGDEPSSGQKAKHSKEWQVNRGVELYVDGNEDGKTYSYDQAAMCAIDESKNKPGGYPDTVKGRASLAKAIEREVKKRNPNLRQ